MAKNLLLNAQVSTMQDVYMIRYKDSGGTEHWCQRVEKVLAQRIEDADLVSFSVAGQPTSVESLIIVPWNVDFSNKTEITHVGSSTSTTVYEAYPAGQAGFAKDSYYIENYNGYHIIVEDWGNEYYVIQYSSEYDSPAGSTAPGLKHLMLKSDAWAEQIQRGSKSLTSVFPGVTYRVATDEVTFNPVYADPYTVEIYLSGSLLDTYVDCDKYYCRGAFGSRYNEIYDSGYDYTGNLMFAMAVFDEYEIEYDPYDFNYAANIQYSTSTSGDSDWTNIGYFRPFPDNVKRVKISIVEEK